MITLKQLQFALAVAENKNFKRAAVQCSVSQSALSTAIAELEKKLGVQLFERDNKRVLITDIGNKILQRAQNVHADINDLISTAKDSSKAMSSPMTIGIIPSIAPYLLPKVLPVLNQQFPEFKLSVIEDVTIRLLDIIQKGLIDCAILALPCDITGLHSFSFWEEDFYAIFSSKKILPLKKEISPEQLKSHNLMLLGDGHCLKDHVLKAGNLSAKDISENFQSASLNTLIQMAAADFGTTLVPEIALEQLFAQHKNIQAYRLKATSPHRILSFVCRLHYARVDEIKIIADLFNEQLKANKV